MVMKLSNTYKGAIAIVVGFFALLYTLGIIEKGINLLFVLASIALIIYGLIISGLYAKIQTFIKRHGK